VAMKTAMKTPVTMKTTIKLQLGWRSAITTDYPLTSAC
jgi:hypothetical protein